MCDRRTEKDFAKTARELKASGSFYHVSYDTARPFCKAAAVKFVPCAHIYRDGGLLQTLPLGPKAWPAFAARIKEVAVGS